MANKNTSHLAGEFLVAGELSRRGYPVSITMGKAKAVDIYVDAQEVTIRVDTKASQYHTSWPIEKVDEKVYYIFVYLQNEDKLRKESKSNTSTPPEYFIAHGKEIIAKGLKKPWRGMAGVTYASLNNENYKERWDKLPPP
jgi:hypothetical protein